MKNKWKLGLGLLFVTSVALAAKITDNTVIIGDQNPAVDKEIQMGDGRLKWDQATSKLVFSNDSGSSQKEIGSGGGGGAGGITLFDGDDNADFEGASTTPWAASGGTLILESGTPGFGLNSGSWDSGAASQQLNSALKNVPAGLENRHCTASFQYQYGGASGDLKFQVVDSGGGVLAEKDIDANANWSKDFLAYDCPSAEQIGIRILSVASDAAVFLIDNAEIGQSDLVNISQAVHVGSLSYEGITNCDWVVSSTSFVGFPVDNDCNAAIAAGELSAPATKIPAFTMAKVPPGHYKIIATGPFTTASNDTTGFRFHDGTTGSDTNASVGQAGTTTSTWDGQIIGSFDYATTQTNVTFEIQAFNSAGNSPRIIINDTRLDLNFMVYRYPLSSAEALTLETSAVSFNAKHENDCKWSTSSTSYSLPAGDATCAFTTESQSGISGLASVSDGNNQAGILFTPQRAGKMFICASFATVANNITMSARLVQAAGSYVGAESTVGIGANFLTNTELCGLFDLTPTQQQISIETQMSSGTGSYGGDINKDDLGIRWTGFYVDNQFPAPVFTEVQEKMNAGQAGINTRQCRIDNGGTPVVAGDTSLCGWIDSLTDNGVGDTTVNFTAGTFSAEPVCFCTGASSVAQRICEIDFTTIPTSSLARFQVTDPAGNIIDDNFMIECTGK